MSKAIDVNGKRTQVPDNLKAKYIDVSPGEHIDRAIVDVVANHPAYCIFNDILLESKSGDESELERLSNYFRDERVRQADEYKNSDAGKAAEKKRELYRSKLGKVIAEGRKRLPLLDFDSYSQLLQFFADMQDAMDHMGVEGQGELASEIMIAFKNHNMVPGMNVGDQFDGENEVNFARYLIGQALDGIQSVGSPHQIFHKFYNDWRIKFKK